MTRQYLPAQSGQEKQEELWKREKDFVNMSSGWWPRAN